MLTLLNLLSGCLAVVFTLQGNLMLVPILIGISMLADFLDGLVARALDVHSEIGKQLDSLADMVSFGVLPSIILFTFVEREWNTPLNILINLLPFLIAMFSALRLAKFNIDETQSEEFKGLATPASTLMVAGLLMANMYQNIEVTDSLVFSLSLILPILLVSNIPMFSFKLKGFSWQKAGWQYVFLAIVVLLLVVFKFLGLSLSIMAYVLINILRKFVVKQ
jgi:CDP-diacylglycerol--serine O-phosphatidyltransferase